MKQWLAMPRMVREINATLTRVYLQGAKIMAGVLELQNKVKELIAAQEAEAKRQADSDAADAAKMAALQKAVDDLTAQLANAGLPADVQAGIDESLAGVQKTIDALNAEDQPVEPQAAPTPAA